MITQKTNHVEEAKANLISQYKGKPVIEAIITSYVNQIQELENVFFDLMVKRWLDNAEGAQLDGFGQIVDESRQGRNDTDYKFVLKAKRVAIMSQGTIEDVIDLFTSLLESVTVEISETYPAAFMAYIRGSLAGIDWDLVKKMVNTTKPVGVEAFIVITPSNAFTFDDATYTWDVGVWAGFA